MYGYSHDRNRDKKYLKMLLVPPLTLLRSHYLHASSYRSEILGAIAVQLILRAATRNASTQYREIPTYCNNRGVLNHGSQAEKELKETQAQFDFLRFMKPFLLQP